MNNDRRPCVEEGATMEKSLPPINDIPPYPMPPYSDFCWVEVLVSILLSAFLSLPLFLWKSDQKRAERQREEQAQWDRQLIELEKAARDPRAGEAAHRLLGIRTRSQTASQGSTAKARPKGHRE
jgi:hypothetical protein